MVFFPTGPSRYHAKRDEEACVLLTVGQLSEPLTGRHWNASAATREVSARAGRYRRRGLRPDDRVFLPFGNRLEVFAELLAIWRLGGVAVPVDGTLTRVELERLAEMVAPRFSVVDDATDGAIVGDRAYAGMGRSLFEAPVTAGIISGDTFYFKDGFALRYRLNPGQAELLAVDGDAMPPTDLSREHPEVASRLTRESLALYETTDRLMRENHLFPIDPGAARPPRAP